MDLKLHNKVVLITGGSTGIGLETARAFGSEGCKLAICGRNRSKLEKAQQCLSGQGYDTYFEVTDVTKSDQFEAFAQNVFSKYGKIDIWINNAGMPVHKAMLDVSEEEWHQLIDTNLTAVFLGCRIAAKHMKNNGGGVILNAGSFQSFFPAAGSGPYGAAKAGVCSLTRTFAGELASDNIRVLTYIPGVIETPMANVDDWMIETKQQDNIPLPRLGLPSDIAKALVFLASENAYYINGVNIEITGGKFCVQNPRYSWK